MALSSLRLLRKYRLVTSEIHLHISGFAAQLDLALSNYGAYTGLVWRQYYLGKRLVSKSCYSYYRNEVKIHSFIDFLLITALIVGTLTHTIALCTTGSTQLG